MYAHKSASCKVQFAAKKQAGQFFVGKGGGRKEESICSSSKVAARSSTRIRQMADEDKKQNSGGNKQEGGKADRDGTSPIFWARGELELQALSSGEPEPVQISFQAGGGGGRPNEALSCLVEVERA